MSWVQDKKLLLVSISTNLNNYILMCEVMFALSKKV